MSIQVEQNTQLALENGLRLIKQGHYFEALDRFQKHLENYPGDVAKILIPLYRILRIKEQDIQLKSIIAQLYLTTKRYRDAVDEIEEIIELNPEHTHSYFLLRKIYNKGVLEDRVIALYELAFEQDILDSSILDLLPKVYLEKKVLDKGTHFFERLIIHRPGNLQYYKTLATLYIQSDRFEDAVKTYATIIEVAPDLSVEAAQQCFPLSEKEPTSKIIHSHLVDFYLKSVQPDEAATHLLHLTALSHNDLETVTRHYKQALENYPKTASLQIGLSKCLILQAQYTEASEYLVNVFNQTFDHTEKLIPILKEILEKCPEQIIAMQLLSDIYISMSQPTETLVYLDLLSKSQMPPIDFIEKTVHTLYAKYSECRGDAGLILARTYLKLGNEDACKKECQALYQTSALIPVKLIEVELLEGKQLYKESLQELLPLIKQFPESKEVHDALRTTLERLIDKKLIQTPAQDIHERGMLYLYNHNVYDALENLQKIPMAHKEYLHSQVLIGRCFLELGRYDMSINQFNRTLKVCEASDLKTANLLRFVIGLNQLYLGQNKEAIQTFESILEFDIHFPNASPLISYLKQQSLLDLRGQTVSGCFNNYNTDLCLIAVHNSEEEHNEESHLQRISFAHPHNNQGVEHLFKQNLKSAEAELILATQMDTKLTSAYCNLSIVRLLQNNTSDALLHLDTAEELNKKLDIVFLNRGLVFSKLHDWEKAIEQFQKALKLNPKNSLAYLNLGDVFYEQNRLKLAFQNWKKASELGILFHHIQRRIQHMTEPSFDNAHWIDSTALELETVIPTT